MQSQIFCRIVQSHSDVKMLCSRRDVSGTSIQYSAPKAGGKQQLRRALREALRKMPESHNEQK